MTKKDRLRSFELALSGALAALPVCFSEFSLVAFFSFVPMLYFLFSEFLAERARFRPSHYYKVGLLILMPYFIVVFHWFTYLWPLDFVSGMTLPAAVAIILLACLGLPLLQSLGFAFLFWFLARLARTRSVRRAPLLLPFLFAALWTLFAFTQTLTWAGVPWGAQLALSQYSNPFLLQSASLFGSYFVTFVIAAVNACLAYALVTSRGAKRSGARLGALAACLVFLLNLGLSGIAYAIPVTEESRITAAVLQGNIPSAKKWEVGTDCIGIYGELAREAAAAGADLVIWPETAVPSYLMAAANLARVRAIAAETGAVQIIGTYAADLDEDRNIIRRNAFYLIYPDGKVSENVYFKRHLVPFGEYVPMEDFIRAVLPQLANLEMLADGSTITPGDSPALFDEPFGCIGGLICFDSIYEELCRDSVAAGAELIALGTNDSWFFDSAAVHMHNGQAVLRAVENGRYVLRAANTGVSSVIDPKGNVLVSIEPLIEGQAVCEVGFVTSRTLYNRIGNLFLLLCQVFVLLPPALSLAARLRRRLFPLDK